MRIKSKMIKKKQSFPANYVFLICKEKITERYTYFFLFCLISFPWGNTTLEKRGKLYFE